MHKIWGLLLIVHVSNLLFSYIILYVLEKEMVYENENEIVFLLTHSGPSYNTCHVLWLKLKRLSDWNGCKFHSDWNFKLYKNGFQIFSIGKKNPQTNTPHTQKCEPQRYLEKQRTLCAAICQKKLFQIICKIGPLANYMPNLVCQVPLISIGSLLVLLFCNHCAAQYFYKCHICK